MRILSVAITCFCMMGLPQISFAAEQRLIEEIIVTATKREQSIQDVPIAVSAFSGEDLDARGVVDLYGLQEVSPSISVYSSNSTSNGGTLRIRGVGTTGNNPGLEAAVGTFIDGVYRSRAGLAFSDLVDIDRIEILRGPQGTLFGKNTSAGALHIITKKPEFEPSGSVALSLGDFGLVRAQAAYTNTLVEDTLAFRISANFNERDGYYEDNQINDAYDRRDRYTVKAQLLWTPNDSIENRIIVDYTDKDEDCCPARYEFVNRSEPGTSSTTRGDLSGEPPGLVIDDLLSALNRPPPNADFPNDEYEVGLNFKPFELVEDWGIQNELRWDINDDVTLVSITAFREYEVERGQDIDFSGADILQPQFVDERFENFSQEFQLTFGTENIDFLVGAYFYTEDIETDEGIRIASQGPDYLSRYIWGVLDPTGIQATIPDGTLFGVFPLGTTTGSGLGSYDAASGMLVGGGVPRANFREGDGYRADYFQDTEGWSIFTHNVWHATDRLSFTIGARFSSEEKDATTIINGVAPITGTERDLIDAMLNDEFNEDHCNGMTFIGATCNIVSWQDDNTEDEWTGTLKVGYALTEDINVYGSYSRGYKAGGFNLDQQAIEMDSFATWLATGGDARFLAPDGTAANIPQDVLDATGGTGTNGFTQFACGAPGGTPTLPGFIGQGTKINPGILQADCAFFDDDHAFDPEFVDAYELGLKGSFLDGTLTANLALFYSDFDDFQVNTFTGTGFLISNTNEMISKGAEIETMWNAADGVYLTFGLTYADARYGDSLNAPGETETSLFLAQRFSELEDFQSLENIEGRQITHAPYWQGSASAFIEQPIGNAMGYGNLNIGYRGEHNTGSDLKNEKDVSDQVIVNLQLGLRSQDYRWDAQIWARNLLDNQVTALVFNSVFQGGSFSTFFGPPRMVGLTVSTNF